MSYPFTFSDTAIMTFTYWIYLVVFQLTSCSSINVSLLKYSFYFFFLLHFICNSYIQHLETHGSSLGECHRQTCQFNLALQLDISVVIYNLNSTILRVNLRLFILIFRNSSICKTENSWMKTNPKQFRSFDLLWWVFNFFSSFYTFSSSIKIVTHIFFEI